MSGHNMFEAVMPSRTELMESCMHIQRKISLVMFGIFQRREGERKGKREKGKKKGKLENSGENLSKIILEKLSMKHFQIMRQISVWVYLFQMWYFPRSDTWLQWWLNPEYIYKLITADLFSVGHLNNFIPFITLQKKKKPKTLGCLICWMWQSRRKLDCHY